MWIPATESFREAIYGKLKKGSGQQACRIKPGTDYLREEIRRRVAKGPVTFRLVLQIAEPGDWIDDPSVAWPDDRPAVELGTLAITSDATDSQAAERSLLFLPGALTQGIEPADPMVQERRPPTMSPWGAGVSRVLAGCGECKIGVPQTAEQDSGRRKFPLVRHGEASRLSPELPELQSCTARRPFHQCSQY